jgi:hypothetical protein
LRAAEHAGIDGIETGGEAMDRAEHDRRLAERVAEPVQKSGVGELIYKDHIEPIETDVIKLDTTSYDPERPFSFFGDARDDYLVGELQAAFTEQTDGILKVLRRERTEAIAAVDERLARLEGSINTLIAIHGMTADKIGNLKGAKGERGERG